MLTSIWAEKFDHAAAVTNFVVAPLSLLSGTFYSVEGLSPVFRAIGHANPFFYIISGFRYGFLGVADSPILLGSAGDPGHRRRAGAALLRAAAHRLEAKELRRLCHPCEYVEIDRIRVQIGRSGRKYMASEDDIPKSAQTLMRGLDILDETLLGPTKMSAVATKLGLSKTTTHRLAHALRSRGYLSITAEIALGPKLLQLGAVANEQVDYVGSRPISSFCPRAPASAFVGKREGDWSRHLDRVTGRQKLRVATAPSDQRPIAETGLGKALLFDDSEEGLQEALPHVRGGELQSRGRGCLACRDARACRARDRPARQPDRRRGASIAAPVRDANGNICVAISIASAAHYLTDTVMAEVVGHVAEIADKVSKALSAALRPRHDPRLIEGVGERAAPWPHCLRSRRHGSR